MEARKIKNPNGTYCYTLDGEVVRKASKRDYKHMLVEIYSDGTAGFVGLGNKAAALKSSWSRLYPFEELKVIDIKPQEL